MGTRTRGTRAPNQADGNRQKQRQRAARECDPHTAPGPRLASTERAARTLGQQIVENFLSRLIAARRIFFQALEDDLVDVLRNVRSVIARCRGFVFQALERRCCRSTADEWEASGQHLEKNDTEGED